MAFFNTEIHTEVILFSVDAILSVIVFKSYKKVSGYLKSLQEVSSNKDTDVVANIKPGEIKYVLVQGPVKALSNSIPSVYVPNTFGVVQELSTEKLMMSRTSSGVWIDRSSPLHRSYNVVPFAIAVGKFLIEVQDVMQADELHLDTVYNKYDPTVHTLSENLWSLFSGVRQYGLQTTEEMLKEGTVVTGIGNLMLSPEGSRILVPPADGSPYFITTKPLASLMHNFGNKKTVLGAILVVTSGLTVFFGSLLIRRMWTNWKKRKERLELQQRLEESRRARRQNVRDNELEEVFRCVVCQENPKEIILLPCGHLCVCEDCSARLGSSCPICRRQIDSRAAAFLS